MNPLAETLAGAVCKCGHPVHAHEADGCEFDYGDDWLTCDCLANRYEALAPTVARLVREAEERAVGEVARRIEARRNEHWQEHLRLHPLADGRSCPKDYGKHDAYLDAANIARAVAGGDE